jgi:hypothetical protein
MPEDQLSTSIYSNDEIALLRITEQRDILVKELRLTKANLEAEKKTTYDLNQRLIMKAISIDCQLADTEEKFSKTQTKIDAANQKNNELCEKLRATKMENENLMKRTAALARRDQIQKATILTSNAEILKLMSTIEAFQERFLSLADAVVTANETNMTETERELSKDDSNDSQSTITISLQPSSDDSVTPFEQDQVTPGDQEPKQAKEDAKAKQKQEFEAREEEYEAKVKEYMAKQEELIEKEEHHQAKQKEFVAKAEAHRAKQKQWLTERDDLFGCITKLKSNNAEIKKKFVQTLKKHQWKWHKQKEKLLKQVGDLEVLLEEKEAELIMAKTALADVVARGKFKGDLEHSDTLTTLTTQDESLSTCSSSSELTLTHSLTETSNNLSAKGKAIQKLDIFEQVDNGSYSFLPMSPHYVDTPPRSNGSATDELSSIGTMNDELSSNSTMDDETSSVGALTDELSSNGTMSTD